MDRDILFRKIDEDLLAGFMKGDDTIQKAIKSYSSQEFLGFATLSRDRNLEMTPRDKERATFLLNVMRLKRIFFGVFSLTYINMQNMRPEPGQNYDASHIVSHSEL